MLFILTTGLAESAIHNNLYRTLDKKETSWCSLAGEFGAIEYKEIKQVKVSE